MYTSHQDCHIYKNSTNSLNTNSKITNDQYWYQVSNQRKRSGPNMSYKTFQIILILSTKRFTTVCLVFIEKSTIFLVAKFSPDLNSCLLSNVVLAECFGEEAVLFSGHELSEARQRRSCPCSQGLSSAS